MKSSLPATRIKRQSLVVGSDDRAELMRLALDAIVAALIASGAPFVKPDQIAPHLGISPNTVRYYCRQCTATKLWTGQYKFELHDPEHIEAMTNVIRLALWSMKSAPNHRKPAMH